MGLQIGIIAFAFTGLSCALLPLELNVDHCLKPHRGKIGSATTLFQPYSFWAWACDRIESVLRTMFKRPYLYLHNTLRRVVGDLGRLTLLWALQCSTGSRTNSSFVWCNVSSMEPGCDYVGIEVKCVLAWCWNFWSLGEWYDGNQVQAAKFYARTQNGCCNCHTCIKQRKSAVTWPLVLHFNLP